MFSFIIIGRNEGKWLQQSLSSIENTIKHNNLNAEILYVDSNSTDNSIHIAKSFSKIRIFIIKKNYNAAIARNIGATKSIGDILVFLDGDMELISNFFSYILNASQKLIYPFISGQFINKYYDLRSNYLHEEKYCKTVLFNDNFESTTGGLFIITRELWESVKGMRTEFRRSQDLDLGLRLAKRSHLLLRKKEVMAIHHTISYTHKKRIWADLFKGNTLYRSLLYRKNLFNIYTIKRMLKKDNTALLLLLFGMLFIIFKFLWILLAYFILIVIASILRYKKNFSIDKIFYIILRDIISITSFLFFHPVPKFFTYYKLK